MGEGQEAELDGLQIREWPSQSARMQDAVHTLAGCRAPTSAPCLCLGRLLDTVCISRLRIPAAGKRPHV